MKKLLLIFVLLSLLINQTTLAYTLTKVDTKIANNKIKILNERIKKGYSYQIIYKQQLSLQNNIKKKRDSKNIKSIAYKNLDKNYTISQYILENLINYGTVKQNTISNPPVKKQDTLIQEQTVVKKQNCDDGWYYNEGTMSCQPNNPVRSCNITNGTGKQTWNGNNWNTCTVTSCISGYSISNGSCLVNQPTQQTSPISNQITCSSDQHTENNTCVSNIKSCTVSNGIGQQSWNSDAWGNCNISSCNTGYSISGNSCIQNQPTCSSDQHIENNACISNTKSCTISNGTGEQNWNSDAWGNCILNEVIVSKYPGCDIDDIKLSNGQIWAACNVGSTIAGFLSTSYGNYYQYGEGICDNSYHIPTINEWRDAGYAICLENFKESSRCINLGGQYDISPIVAKTLKLPMAGGHINTENPQYYLYSSSPYKFYEGSYYWSSTSISTNKTYGAGYRINSIYGLFTWQYDNMENKYPIRCIKD